MKWVLIADIHGNLEALDRAKETIQAQGLKDIVVLGDSIGYGANPDECFKWALENSKFHVLGNHEAAVILEGVVETFAEWARKAIEWTARRMDKTLVQKMKTLPYLQIHQDMTFVHGSVYEPEEFHYTFDLRDASKSFHTLQTRVGFIGHTHVPSVFPKGKGEAKRLEPGILKLKKGESYILNPGSIGQPRDRDPKLSFGIFDDEELTFEIVRLEYDNQLAAQKIRAEHLPSYLADRLIKP